MVSVILLLCGGPASLVLGIFQVVPDILGFASSLPRGSPYFERLSPGGSLLDDDQRARKFRSLESQIVDVRPEAAVAHVAFVPSQVHSDGQRERRGKQGLGRRDAMIETLLSVS